MEHFFGVNYFVKLILITILQNWIASDNFSLTMERDRFMFITCLRISKMTYWASYDNCYSHLKSFLDFRLNNIYLYPLFLAEKNSKKKENTCIDRKKVVSLRANLVTKASL